MSTLVLWMKADDSFSDSAGIVVSEIIKGELVHDFHFP